MRVSFFIFFLCIASLVWQPQVARAQVAEKKLPVVSREKDLLTLYQAQVERYRETERTFGISKAQYFKLNTLQSLEKTVVDARTTMEVRNQVLITYLELLHEILQNTQGIELARKTETLQSIEDQVRALRAHSEAVEKSVSREDIASRADEFEPLGARAQQTAVTVQGLVVIGRLQAVYDAALSAHTAILERHKENPVSALKQSERERAYTEVTAQITLVSDQFKKARTTFENEVSHGGARTDTTIEQLNTVYASTSQLLAFLKELVLKLT